MSMASLHSNLTFIKTHYSDVCYLTVLSIVAVSHYNGGMGCFTFLSLMV